MTDEVIGMQPLGSALGHTPGMRSDRNRTAVLLDVENIARVRDGWIDPDGFERRMVQIDPHLARADYVAAAGAKHTLQRYLLSIVSRGIHFEIVPSTPDAADRALLDCADFLSEHGYTQVTVVSGDHAFAPLAEDFVLTVVTRPGQLSRTLERAADHVVVLGPCSSHPARTTSAPRRTPGAARSGTPARHRSAPRRSDSVQHG